MYAALIYRPMKGMMEALRTRDTAAKKRPISPLGRNKKNEK
jgi:hypothetical protein